MSNMKRILIHFCIFTSILITSNFEANSQNLSDFNQYLFKPTLINPSFYSVVDQPIGTIGHRRQWLGINDAPNTTMLHVVAPIEYDVTVGGSILYDQSGILNNFMFMGGASYRLHIDKKQTISFGLSLGGNFTGADFSQIEEDISSGLLDPDITLSEANKSTFWIRGQAGISYINENMWLGLSFPDLFENDFFGHEGVFAGLNPENTANLYFKYRLYNPRYDQWQFGPIVSVNYNSYSKSYLDVAMYTTYNNMFTVAGGYRLNYGVLFMLEFSTQNNLDFSYSYDWGLQNKLNPLKGSSHELTVSLRFGKERNTYYRGKKLISQNKGRRTALVARSNSTPPPREQPAPRVVEERPTPPPVVEERPAPPPVVEERPAPPPVIVEEPEPEPVVAEPEPVIEEPEPEPVVEPEPVIEEPQPVEEEFENDIPTRPPLPTIFEQPEEPAEEPAPIIEEQPIEDIPVFGADLPVETEEEEVADEVDLYPEITPDIVTTEGNHPMEMQRGHYVIVADFPLSQDATDYMKEMEEKGFFGQFGYSSDQKKYFVYTYRSPSKNNAMREMNRVKRISYYKDTKYMLVN